VLNEIPVIATKTQAGGKTPTTIYRQKKEGANAHTRKQNAKANTNKSNGTRARTRSNKKCPLSCCVSATL